MLKLLSYDQATAERGFLFNKEIMTHNMKEQMVVALRAVVDHVAYVGGLDKMTITRRCCLQLAVPEQPRILIWQKRKSRM
jgi:hypothetical protein